MVYIITTHTIYILLFINIRLWFSCDLTRRKGIFIYYFRSFLLQNCKKTRCKNLLKIISFFHLDIIISDLISLITVIIFIIYYFFNFWYGVGAWLFSLLLFIIKIITVISEIKSDIVTSRWKNDIIFNRFLLRVFLQFCERENRK